MKKILNILSVVFITLVLTSCEEDLKVYDADNGQTALSFSRASASVNNCAPQVDVVLQSTTRSSQDRSFSIVVDAENTTATPAQYSAPNSITIPAGEFTGTATVTIDFDEVSQGSAESLVLSISPTGDDVINTRGSIAINYTGVCTDNVVNLNFVFDDYPEETAWVLFNATTGTAVAQSSNPLAFGAYAGQDTFSQTFCLPSGPYVLRVFDQFGDGICCSYGNGSFNVSVDTCDGSTNVATGGSFGGTIDVPFTL